MKKSEIENDASYLIQALKNDYDIPSFGTVMLVILKIMLPVYISVAYIYLLNEIIYAGAWSYWVGALGMYALTCGLLSFIVTAMLYQHAMLYLCLGEEVSKKSIIINLILSKAKVLYLLYLLVNNLVGVFLLFYKEGAVVLFGLSWFTFLILFAFGFSLIIGGYMTPAVTATLSKVSEVLSSKGSK